jgi:hypothetical protein
MRLAGTSLIAAMTLVLVGQGFAIERKPCGPGEQEVMAKDRTTMCVKAYGVRPESKGHVAYQRPPLGPASASLNPTR